MVTIVTVIMYDMYDRVTIVFLGSQKNYHFDCINYYTRIYIIVILTLFYLFSKTHKNIYFIKKINLTILLNIEDYCIVAIN